MRRKMHSTAQFVRNVPSGLKKTTAATATKKKVSHSGRRFRQRIPIAKAESRAGGSHSHASSLRSARFYRLGYCFFCCLVSHQIENARRK